MTSHAMIEPRISSVPQNLRLRCVIMRHRVYCGSPGAGIPLPPADRYRDNAVTTIQDAAVVERARPADRLRAVRIWLYAVAACVLLMVVVGGITRLTESGLSITSWKPLSGTIPPLNDADWQ